MEQIKELLCLIDEANQGHHPELRADLADALVIELREVFTDDELAEYAKAKTEGRVLPCKVGDAIYVLTADSLDGIEETTVNRIVIKKNKVAINADCVHDD